MPPRYKLRIAVVTLLALAPVVFLSGVGMYHLWDRGWSFTAYWPMALCWLTAYLLGRYWTRRRKPAEQASVPTPEYWTDRDRAAWKIVEAHAVRVPALTADQFGDLNRYAADAQEMALQVARVYKPSAADPFGHLTLPEILACGELVAHDLTVWTQLLLFDGEHAVCEPKRLRYRLLHVAGRLTRHARRLTLHLPADWPWTGAIAKAFKRLTALPA